MELSKLPFNKELGIYISDANMLTDYSEGEKAENYIYETLRDSSDNSVFSPILQSKIKDWSSEYHFSPYRSNILRPIEITPLMDVLEIGAGCGVITRYLGETGANILAVEGALNRAKCIKERCKDLNNVKVVCSNIDAITFDKKFDIVSLIGVFEYTAKYSQKENPFEEALKFYRQLLKPDGILVIAIENKLGLKYFSGYNEDHYGAPYIGLEDRYPLKDVRTFGKREIFQLLEKTGFDSPEMLYPFPDYKLPKAIFTEKGLSHNHFNAVDIIKNLETRHYTYVPKANLLNESEVWKSLYDNGLVKDFANSFLIIAGNKSVRLEEDNNLLVQHYNCDRFENWSTKMDIFVNNLTSKIEVKKTALSIKEHSNLGLVKHSITNESTKYILGDNLHSLITNAINNHDYLLFRKYIKDWILFLKNNAIIQVNNENLGLSIIKPDFYDCIPTNIILDKEGIYHSIDREWIVKQPITLYTPILRYLRRFKNILGLYLLGFSSFSNFINSILNENNIKKPSSKILNSNEELETLIMKEVHFKVNTAPSKYFKSIFLLLLKLLKDFKIYMLYNKFSSH